MEPKRLNDQAQRTRKSHRIPWKDLGCFIIAVHMGMWTSACVSQEKYDSVLKQNQTLRQENNNLKSKPPWITRPPKSLPPVESGKNMNNQELGRLLIKLAGEVGGQEGMWKIVFKNIPMVVITSPPHDRMRVVAPIPNTQNVNPNELTVLLNSNFDRALDARYALYEGRIWSVFLHPLGSLTESELSAALDQVANLVKTYGSTYSSGHLIFGN